MRAQSAAPEAAVAADLGSDEENNGNSRSLSDLVIPAPILQRLAAHDIRTVIDWLELSAEQCASIFGITRAMVATIDKAVRP